jgi:chemotaxis protein MotB
VSGYADTRPIDSNDSATGRARNRRIEVIVDGAES